MLCTLEVEIMADSGELVVMWIDSDSWKNGLETISETLVNLSWYNDRAPQIHFNRLKNYYKLSRPHGLSLPAKCFARESKYLPMGHTRTLVIHCKSPRILWDIKLQLWILIPENVTSRFSLGFARNQMQKFEQEDKTWCRVQPQTLAYTG